MLSNDLVLKRINENTRKYRIWNEEIYLKIVVAPIDEGEWLEKFVMCKGDRLMHQWEWLIIQFKGMKGDRGRPRITLV